MAAGARGNARIVSPPRVGVVGHVEWVEFAVVDRLPAPGEVVHAREVFGAPGGAGAVAAVQLRRLAGAASFFCALGHDEVAARSRTELQSLGVEVHGAPRDVAQRRCFCHAEAGGERTITVLGERLVPHGDDPLPWDALDGVGGVYFTGGDAAALRAARRADVIVATPRAERALRDAGVAVDVLVHSGKDAAEELDPDELDPPPKTVVTTLGAKGGRWDGEAGGGKWDPLPLRGPRVDEYGAGDSFAAGITTGLAAGMSMRDAIQLGARCGVANLTGRGPYAGQLDLRPR
jgi:ribokinase